VTTHRTSKQSLTNVTAMERMKIECRRQLMTRGMGFSSNGDGALEQHNQKLGVGRCVGCSYESDCFCDFREFQGVVKDEIRNSDWKALW
jgi:hypothetical protein